MKTRVFSSQRKCSRWGGNFRSYFEGLAVVLERTGLGMGNNSVQFHCQSLSFRRYQWLNEPAL